MALAAVAIAGCGGDDEARSEQRPPVPDQHLGQRSARSDITASPDKFGAGPITLLVANQSGAAQTLTLDGPRLRRSVGPINPRTRPR